MARESGDGTVQPVECFWCGAVYDLAYHRRCPDCAGSPDRDEV